jgi:hypothetical protein
MKRFGEWLEEDGGVPGNCVGGGNIPGVGVAPHPEPGINIRVVNKRKRKESVLLRRQMEGDNDT